MNKSQRKQMADLRPAVAASASPLAAQIQDAVAVLEGIKEEEEEKLDNMPESLRQGSASENTKDIHRRKPGVIGWAAYNRLRRLR